MSPTVFAEGGYRFFFFSREEPRLHIHVIGHGAEAKFWLEPTIELARNHGFSKRQLATLQKKIAAHEDEIRRAWQAHFER